MSNPWRLLFVFEVEAQNAQNAQERICPRIQRGAGRQTTAKGDHPCGD